MVLNLTNLNAVMQAKIDDLTGTAESKELLLLTKAVEAVVGRAGISEVCIAGATQLVALDLRTADHIDAIDTRAADKAAEIGNLSANALPKTGGTMTGPARATLIPLTPAANVFAVNGALGNKYDCGVLAASSTLANPTNPPPAGTVQPITIKWTVGPAGGFTMSFGSRWKNIGGAFASTSPNKVNMAVGDLYPDGTVIFSIVKEA